MFVHDGFMYVFDKCNFNNKKRFWRCRYKDICKCQVYTGIDNYLFQKKKQRLYYTHDSEASKIGLDTEI